MESSKKRRSDRISVQLPIVISGVDVLGQNFADPARTVVIARYGAKIQCFRKLSPELEILIQCLMTTEESEARIVGRISESSDGVFYGVELAHPEVNLWGVEFPPIEESETAVGRALLQCSRCRRRELVYLNEFESEALHACGSIWRHCAKCLDVNLWKETWIEADEEVPTEIGGPTGLFPPASGTPGPEGAVSTPPMQFSEAPGPEGEGTGPSLQSSDLPGSEPAGLQLPNVNVPRAPRTRDDRKYVRLSLQMKAFIRDPQGWEEIVVTENISRGGFRFRTKKHYTEGWKIQIALPYSECGYNIFSSARIRYAAPVTGTDENTYGAEYIPWQDAWVDR